MIQVDRSTHVSFIAGKRRTAYFQSSFRSYTNGSTTIVFSHCIFNKLAIADGTTTSIANIEGASVIIF